MLRLITFMLIAALTAGLASCNNAGNADKNASANETGADEAAMASAPAQQTGAKESADFHPTTKYTGIAICQMRCLKDNYQNVKITDKIKEAIKNGAMKRIPDDEKTGSRPCPMFFIIYNVDETRKLKLIVGKCQNFTKVIYVTDNSDKYKNECRDDCANLRN